MYSILGRGFFCFNYCLNSAWHGGDQFVALLRWYGSPGFFDGGLQVICIVGSGVSHLPFDNNRFSMGFRSGEFAGQSCTVTPWSLNQLLVPLAAGPARGIGDIGSCLGRKMTGGCLTIFCFSEECPLVTIVRTCTHILSKMITDS